MSFENNCNPNTYSNTTGVVCGAGTTNPSRAPKFIPDLQWGSRVACL